MLTHSAGVADGASIADATPEVWADLYAVNVVAVARLTRAALPALRAARGLVIAINSGSGLTASPGDGPYAASKFALRAFTDALREEERGAGVRVTSVHPGRTDTDMQRRKVASEGLEYDTALLLAPEDVAAVVRTAVDLPERATLESASIRPTRKR